MKHYIHTNARTRCFVRGLRSVAFVFLLLLGASKAMALPVDYYATSSNLALPGQWVKVKVTDTGIQRISAETLRQWGFRDPSKVHVFGYSAVELAEDRLSTRQPEDVPHVYSRYIDDALYFYGEKDYRVRLIGENTTLVDRNYYSPYSIYFLSDAQVDDITPQQIQFIEREEEVNTHRAFDYVEPEEYNAVSAGTFYFSSPLATNPESGVITFNTPDRTGLGVLEYRNVAYSRVNIKPVPKLTSGMQFTQANINNLINPIKGMQDTEEYNESRYCMLPVSTCLPVKFDEGDVPATVTFSDPGVSDCAYFGLDYTCLYYDRRNNLGDYGQLQIQSPSFEPSQNLLISNCTPATLAWDVTLPLDIKEFEADYSSEDAAMAISPNEGYGSIVVFNPGSEAGFYEPAFVEEIKDTPNLHAMRDPVDLLIIAPTAFLESANKLADLHRNYQGLDVRVVDAQDVYNEFSSGTPTATAYRRYAKFLSDLPDQKLANVLLFGHGVYDNRGLIQTVQDNLMTFEVRENRDNPSGLFRSVVQCYGTDSYFGIFDEDMKVEDLAGYKMDVGVGRVPVKDSSEADKYVKKVEEYLIDHNTASYFTRSTLVSDYGNANNHLILAEQASNIIETSPATPVMTKLYSALYENNAKIFNTLVSTNFAQGMLYWSYSGHGSNSSLLSNSVITHKTLKQYAYGNHAISMLATCSGLILDRNEASIGGTMLKEPQGPVAVVGACRSVYLHLNAKIYHAFTRQLLKNVENQTVGGVFRNAYNEIIGQEYALDLNTLCYNLGGDPALPIPYISQSVAVRTVNGEPAGENRTLTSLTPIALTGEVLNVDGELDADFNGTVTIDLYNGAEWRPTFESGTGTNKDESQDIAMHEGLMATFRAPVVNGKWSLAVTSPMPSRGGTPTLMMIAAVDPDRQVRAMSRFEEITLADPANDFKPADTSGPRISAMYLDSESFLDGDCVGHNATLYAKVDPDESGISVMANPMGRAPSLVVDGKNSYANAAGLLRISTDGSATMSLPLDGLADGAHTAELTVYDNVGNVSRRTIGFTVSNSSLRGSLTVDNEFAIDNATIELGLPTTGTQPTRLIIEDANGNAVVSVQKPSFPYTLNVKSLPEGYYRAMVFLQSETGYGRTPFATFTVLKP